MKKILHATLEMAPGYGVPKFNWSTCRAAEGTCDGEDDLSAYLAKLNLNGRIIVPGADCEFMIYDIPQGTLVVTEEDTGIPREMFWVMDVGGDWFFPDDEYADSIFGSAEFCCLNRRSIERLAQEYEMTVEKLMAMMHEATVTEISKYGIDE